MNRTLLATVALLSLTALVVGAAVLSQPAPQAHPNVLVVMWDTVRADRLSLYGHDAPTTPFLEEIAPESAVFDRAVSASFWTLPSHASLFTGLSVSSHNANAHHPWLDSQLVTLAEHFGDQGYDTYLWSSNPNLHPSSNMVQGFRSVNHSGTGSKYLDAVVAFTETLVREDDLTTKPNPDRHTHTAWHKQGPVIETAFTSWLDEERDPSKPFFAFLNYMEAHTYRLPSEDARQAVMPDPQRYTKALNTPQTLRRQFGAMYRKRRPYTPAERQAIYDLYDASIVDLDSYVRGLFEQLEQRRMLDDTIVVVTSDHGEHLGEHGLYMHSFSVYEPLVHVPLVIHWPRGVEGRRYAAPVSTRALFHTLVELTGVAAPDQPILDHNLLEPPSEPVVTELTGTVTHKQEGQVHAFFNYEIRDWSARYKAIYDGDWKLIWASNGEHELYDLSRDPRERFDLAANQPDRVTEMLAALDAWRAEQPVIEVSDEERSREEALREELQDDELKEQLEQLGYIEN